MQVACSCRARWRTGDRCTSAASRSCSISKATSITACRLPLISSSTSTCRSDGDLPNLDRLRAVSVLGARLCAQGHRVLSHCGMGLNRSALVAGLILMQVHGMTGEQAVARLQQRRPGALFNEVFARYLLEVGIQGI